MAIILRNLLCAAPLLLSLAACDKGEGSLTAECYPSMSSTGHVVKVAHPKRPSACTFGVVMMCNACVYDAQGALERSESEVCGICMGGSF
jgi:hypothetical protein